MKKFLVSLLFVLPLCGFAQKGSQGFSVNLGFETCGYITGYDDILCCKNIPLSIKYLYNLTDRIRIAPHLGYIAANEDECFNTNVYNLGVSFHYFFNKVKPLRPYVIVGGAIGGYHRVVYSPLRISYGDRDEEGNLIYEYYPLGSKYNGLFYSVDLGIGLDCKIKNNLSLQVEALVHPISSLWDYGYFGANIGLTYVS